MKEAIQRNTVFTRTRCASYSKNVTFSVEARNLTDEIQVTNAGQAFRMNEVAWSGRRYFVDVSVKN